MIKTIQYGNSLLQYSIVRSNRRKTSEIIVGSDGVIVRAPLTKPLSEIEGIVEGKKNWIFKKRLDFESRNGQQPNATYSEELGLPYLGKDYSLKISGSHKHDKVILSEKGFKI